MPISWLPLLLFVPHVIEEYPGFPAWATRHFGVTSRAWYVYSHVVLVAGMAALGWLAEGAAPNSVGLLLVVAIQVSLAGNAIFHLATTALFREYSPGVVTGTALFLPATALVVRDAAQTSGQLGTAVILGVVSQVLVIASLWLPMDLGWTSWRRSR